MLLQVVEIVHYDWNSELTIVNYCIELGCSSSLVVQGEDIYTHAKTIQRVGTYLLTI